MRRARTHSRAPLIIIGLTLLLVLACAPAAAGQASSWVRAEYHTGDFKLVAGTQAADIFVAPDDFKVAQIAANDLAEDVARVTGRKPVVRTDVADLSGPVVLVGTLDKNPIIAALVRAGKLDVSHLRGQWESFVIATVPNPLSHV